MFKWFNKNKEIKKPEDKVEEKPKKEIIDFTIEYYPLTKRYYPKYKNSYIYRNSSTGIMETSSFMAYSEYAYSEKDVDEIIKLFKEQYLKENVIIIKR